jgi:alpha-galactosidase
MMLKNFILVIVTLMSLFLRSNAQNLAQTPPMGWNSWDCFGFQVVESQVKATADFMAENLKSHGWEYIVVDMGWYFDPKITSNDGQLKNPSQSIDEWGRLIPDTIKFPSSKNNLGFKPLADYVHSKGLKFGIHIMRGVPWKAVSKNTPIKKSTLMAADIDDPKLNCAWSTAMIGISATLPGMQDYYSSLFELYAAWGIDYIKVDDIAREFREKDMLAIEKAIANCGRPMVLSLSPGAVPLAHADFFQQHANAYRISNDFWDKWSFILDQFKYCDSWSKYITPGHWPDADMLPFGKLRISGADNWVASLLGDKPANTVNQLSRFTDTEKQTVFTLWNIFRSPLMYGGYFPESDAYSIDLLKNDEIIEVGKNSSNNKPLFKTNSNMAWVADVPNEKAKYVALFNISATTADVSVTAEKLGISKSMKVRDLWSHTDLGSFETIFSASLPSHGSGMYKIEYDSLQTSVYEIRNEFEIFPNPANDWLTIYPENKFEGITNIELINSAGSVIKKQNFTNQSNVLSRINVSDLENGFYILNIYGQKSLKSYKVLVQH